MPRLHPSAKRYARAIFDFARENNQMESVYGDLQSLIFLMEKSSDLRFFLENPMIPAAKRSGILLELFAGKVHPLVEQILLFLSAKAKLMMLSEIFEAFEQLYLKARGILPVSIISAREFPAEQTRALEEKLKNKFKQSIKADYSLDKSLLAGFKVKVEDTEYDFSLKTQLDKFKRDVVFA